jgi:hypothetical protein
MQMPVTAMMAPMRVKMAPMRVKIASLNHDEAEPVVVDKAEPDAGIGAAWVTRLEVKSAR